jgi:hypothetical protein
MGLKERIYKCSVVSAKSTFWYHYGTLKQPVSLQVTSTFSNLTCPHLQKCLPWNPTKCPLWESVEDTPLLTSQTLFSLRLINHPWSTDLFTEHVQVHAQQVNINVKSKLFIYTCCAVIAKQFIIPLWYSQGTFTSSDETTSCNSKPPLQTTPSSAARSHLQQRRISVCSTGRQINKIQGTYLHLQCQCQRKIAVPLWYPNVTFASSDKTYFYNTEVPSTSLYHMSTEKDIVWGWREEVLTSSDRELNGVNCEDVRRHVKQRRFPWTNFLDTNVICFEYYNNKS